MRKFVIIALQFILYSKSNVYIYHILLLTNKRTDMLFLYYILPIYTKGY